MIQFYAPEIECSLQLPEEEARHCIKVLRTKPGSVIEVIDGKAIGMTVGCFPMTRATPRLRLWRRHR